MSKCAKVKLSRIEADRMLVRSKKMGRGRVYRCPRCGWWHRASQGATLA